MKKQTLLGAVALSTIALAGQAGAGTLTLAAPAGTPTVTSAVTVANDIKIATSDLTGKVGLAFAPSTGASLPSGGQLATIKIEGGATFSETLLAATFVPNANCQLTAVRSTGGMTGNTTATFLVSGLENCDDTNAIHMIVPIKLDNSNTPVNFTFGLRTEGGTQLDGEPVSTYVTSTKTNAIDFANALKITTTADATPSKVELADKFTTLSDLDLGTVKVEITPNLRRGIANSTNVGANDVNKAVFTLTGDISTVDAYVGAEQFELVDGKIQATVTGNGVVGTHTIGVVTKAAAPVIAASPYTVQTTLSNTDSAVTTEFKPAALSSAVVALDSITREGATYLLPWVASGTLATSSTSNTVVRIANIGDVTGPISIELLTSSKGVEPSTTLVQVRDKLEKGEEAVLTSGDFEAALGADFGRGDIRVTVEGQPGSLIVRRFVQSTTTHALSEVSMGRDTTTGQEPVN